MASQATWFRDINVADIRFQWYSSERNRRRIFLEVVSFTPVRGSTFEIIVIRYSCGVICSAVDHETHVSGHYYGPELVNTRHSTSGNLDEKFKPSLS